jgi:hypothetical protein
MDPLNIRQALIYDENTFDTEPAAAAQYQHRK